MSDQGGIAFLPGSMTPYDLQGEIESAVALVRDHTMVTFSRLATTYQIAAFCDDSAIPGAFVECGVWKGGVSALMALANLRHGSTRRALHLFDSFQDMCEPDESVDGERAVREARQWANRTDRLTGALVAMDGFYSTMGGPGSAAGCRDLLRQVGYPEDEVFVHEGWFQDTVPGAKEALGEIAILRLDSDFYASTRYCLEHLFDRVVPGGFVIFDDYGCYEGCKKAVDEFLGGRSPHYFLHHADAECRYIQKALEITRPDLPEDEVARTTTMDQCPIPTGPPGTMPSVPAPDPWIRESLWSEAVDRLDRELAEDLSNIGELCRAIPLRIFGQILLDPLASLDRAGSFLPTMPSDDVQQLWTGNCGISLLEQSVDFIRTVVEAAALQEMAPSHCRVLDFGIGWGRLARLWLKYGAPDQLDGCDAWDESLEKSRECGLRNRLVRSDPLLNDLPFEEGSFDIIWAFSVFTHLSPEAMHHGLAGLRRMLRERGTLVFTVRPRSYWDLPQPRELLNGATQDRLVSTEDVTFLQHQSDDPYYGDISVSAQFLGDTCRKAGLDIVSMGWGTVDPYQISVIVRPI